MKTINETLILINPKLNERELIELLRSFNTPKTELEIKDEISRKFEVDLTLHQTVDVLFALISSDKKNAELINELISTEDEFKTESLKQLIARIAPKVDMEDLIQFVLNIEPPKTESETIELIKKQFNLNITIEDGWKVLGSLNEDERIFKWYFVLFQNSNEVFKMESLDEVIARINSKIDKHELIDLESSLPKNAYNIEYKVAIENKFGIKISNQDVLDILASSNLDEIYEGEANMKGGTTTELEADKYFKDKFKS